MVIADVRRLPVATLFTSAFNGPRRLRYILFDHEFLGAVARGAGVPAARHGYRDFLCMFAWAHAPIRMADRGSGSPPGRSGAALDLLLAREVGFRGGQDRQIEPANLGREDEATDLDDKVEVFDSGYGATETNRRRAWITISVA